MTASPQSLCAQSESEEADRLFESGELANYLRAGEVYSKLHEDDPKDYQSAWKAARAYREYAQNSKEQGVEDWQSICQKYGKLGMEFGEKAIAIDPKAIEGHFWYGCSVGNYSDGVSILTALREGLKDKTQQGLEKAYEIDRKYKDGGPIKALGRFWFVLPWPLADKEKSLKYLKEHQELFPDDVEGQIFLAEALIDRKESSAAKRLLEKAVTSDRTYYADWAKRLLKNL